MSCFKYVGTRIKWKPLTVSKRSLDMTVMMNRLSTPLLTYLTVTTCMAITLQTALVSDVANCSIWYLPHFTGSVVSGENPEIALASSLLSCKNSYILSYLCSYWTYMFMLETRTKCSLLKREICSNKGDSLISFLARIMLLFRLRIFLWFFF